MRVRKITRLKSIENFNLDEISQILLDDSFKHLKKVNLQEHEGFCPGDHLNFTISRLGSRKFTAEVIACRNSDQKQSKVLELIKLDLGLRFLRYYLSIKPVRGGFIEIHQQVTFATNGPVFGYLWRNGIKNFLSQNHDAIISRYARKRPAYSKESQLGQLRHQRKLQTEF